METILSISDEQDSESTGFVASAIDWWRTKLETLRFCFAESYEVKVGPAHNIWLHMCAVAGFLEARFQIQPNGQAAYFASHECEYTGGIAMFGGALLVMIMVAKMPRARGHQTVYEDSVTWVKGLWMGKDLFADDHLVMTVQGLAKGRVIRRLSRDRTVGKELLRETFRDPSATPGQWSHAGTFWQSCSAGPQRRGEIAETARLTASGAVQPTSSDNAAGDVLHRNPVGLHEELSFRALKDLDIDIPCTLR